MIRMNLARIRHPKPWFALHGGREMWSDVGLGMECGEPPIKGLRMEEMKFVELP